MSPPQVDTALDDHVTRYNQLPLIHQAYETLRRELGEPDTPLDDLVSPILQDTDVCNLFRHGVTGEVDDPDRERFGFWIVHRHFNLAQGEHMVSEFHRGEDEQPSQITRPIPQDLSHIAERWDLSTKQVEFLVYGHGNANADLSLKPPSTNFATEFQRLMNEKFRVPVTVFGLCLAPCALQPGTVFLETTLGDAEERTQVTTLVPATGRELVAGYTTYQSAWSVLERNGVSIACKTGECLGCPTISEPAQPPTDQQDISIASAAPNFITSEVAPNPGSFLLDEVTGS
jgi:hypothetical protein